MVIRPVQYGWLLGGIVLFVIGVWQCSDSREERFIRTYRDILIIRERFPDTAVANPKVRALLKKNGFTREEFREVFLELAQEPDRFRRLLDSLRQYARQSVQQEKSQR